MQASIIGLTLLEWPEHDSRTAPTNLRYAVFGSVAYTRTMSNQQ